MPLRKPFLFSTCCTDVTVEENMQLMMTLDDAWDAQDWNTLNNRHAEDVAVYWPGQQEPARGRSSHQKEAEDFFKAFPDNRVKNDPYLILFGQGEWTCSVALFRGTHKGPLMAAGGKSIPPTNKKLQVEFCTVARWKNKEIVEEKFFYDQAGMMRPLGLM